VDVLAFSPDGKVLASAGQDCLLKLWEVSTGREIATLQGHLSGIRYVAFTPDGTTLISAGVDANLRVWDVPSLREKMSFDRRSVLALSPDGCWLAERDDTKIRIRRLTDLSESSYLEGHTNWVVAGQFSPDGRLLATGGFDDTVRLWD